MVAGCHGAVQARRRAKLRAGQGRATELETLFKTADADGSGQISREEIADYIMQRYGQTPNDTEIGFIMKVADTRPPEGRLGMEEFAVAITSWECYREEFAPGARLAVLFDDCDVHKIGSLDQEQLRTLLGRYSNTAVRDDDAAAVLKQADAIGDGSGGISRIELQLALAFWFQRYAQTMQSVGSEATQGSDTKPPTSKSCSIL